MRRELSTVLCPSFSLLFSSLISPRRFSCKFFGSKEFFCSVNPLLHASLHLILVSLCHCLYSPSVSLCLSLPLSGNDREEIQFLAAQKLTECVTRQMLCLEAALQLLWDSYSLSSESLAQVKVSLYSEFPSFLHHRSSCPLTNLLI
jgi:hypothetical protein